MFTQVREAFAAVPGVDAAATSFVTPVSGSTWNLAIRVPGYDANDRRGVLFNGVSPDYFSAMGTPLLAGRDIADTDRSGAPNVMVVNEAFAKKFFNGQNPVGKTFTILGFTKDRPDREMQIVGMVANAKYQRLREAGAADHVWRVRAGARSSPPARASRYAPPARRWTRAMRSSRRLPACTRTSPSISSGSTRISAPTCCRNAWSPTCRVSSAAWRCCSPRSDSTA